MDNLLGARHNVNYPITFDSERGIVVHHPNEVKWFSEAPTPTLTTLECKCVLVFSDFVTNFHR